MPPTAHPGPLCGPVPLEDVAAVRGVVSPAVRAIIDLQLVTGATEAELCGLHPADVDVTGTVWTFNPSGTDRHISIGPRGQQALAPFLRNARPYRTVFCTAGEYRLALARGCRAAGVPAFDPHRLRVTAALLIGQRCGAMTAAEVMGHSTGEAFLARGAL